MLTLSTEMRFPSGPVTSSLFQLLPSAPHDAHGDILGATLSVRPVRSDIRELSVPSLAMSHAPCHVVARCPLRSLSVRVNVMSAGNSDLGIG